MTASVLKPGPILGPRLILEPGQILRPGREQITRSRTISGPGLITGQRTLLGLGTVPPLFGCEDPTPNLGPGTSPNLSPALVLTHIW